ncbi:MAG: hypothetical protein ACRBCL_14350 [Maritimibacter sp.]
MENPAEIETIRAKLADEIKAFDPATHRHKISDWNAALLADFQAALIDPTLIEVNLPGGVSDFAYAVTRSNGAYRVIYLPWIELFSLAVESKFGPLDINVHGDAIGCFSSV